MFLAMMSLVIKRSVHQRKKDRKQVRDAVFQQSPLIPVSRGLCTGNMKNSGCF